MIVVEQFDERLPSVRSLFFPEMIYYQIHLINSRISKLRPLLSNCQFPIAPRERVIWCSYRLIWSILEKRKERNFPREVGKLGNRFENFISPNYS